MAKKRTKSPTPALSDSATPAAGSDSLIATWRTALVHRAQLHFAPYNPRSIDKSALSKLKKSVKRFSHTSKHEPSGKPLITLASNPTVNQRTWNIVGGHQRIQAIDANLSTTDYYLTVSLVDLDDAAERALNLALNNQSLQGQFDIALLEQVLLEIPSEQLDHTGFGKQDLALMLSEEGLATIFGESSEIAQQALAEASIVDTLATIRDSSKAYEEQQKANGQSDQPTADVADDDRGDAVESGSHESGTGAVSDRHGGKFQDVPGDSSEAQEETPTEGAKPVDKNSREALIARRHAYRSSVQDADDAQFYVAFVFDSSSQLDQVLSAMKLDTGTRYQPGAALAELAGVILE